MDFGLKGKVAVVAAASKGLGKACALELAREGCAVAICAREEAALHAAAQEISAATGSRVVPVVADMTSAEDITRFIATAKGTLGDPLILGHIDRVEAVRRAEAFGKVLHPLGRLAAADHHMAQLGEFLGHRPP